MTTRFLSRRMQVLLTALLAGALSGCTNIQDDGTRTRTEGAMAGAAAGAAVGAGVGALAKKGKPEAIAGGAAAGALVGGLAGAAYGDSVAKKKEGYAQQETTLEGQLTGLQRQIASRQAYNEKLAATITAKEQQLQAVLAADRSAGPTVQEFDLRTSVNSQLSQIARDSRSWKETIAAHKAVLEKAGADPRKSELQAEIDHLSEQQSELLRQRARLISINEKLGQ